MVCIKQYAFEHKGLFLERVVAPFSFEFINTLINLQYIIYMNLKKYYGPRGAYLEEHKNYFSKRQLKKDVDFLVDVLNLSKKDAILDLACGHGRHTIELKKRGFNTDGLDFSDHLIKIANQQARRENLQINFYRQDIHNINLKKKYDKIFLFFSEFGLFNANKVLKNVRKVLKKNGLFLLDCDNLFRLIQYLNKHPESPYKFDFSRMKLKENRKTGSGVKYYTALELEKLFQNNKLEVVSVYGDYKKNALGESSKRIIMIGTKV